ncbi:hypothetical protein [Methylopila sp. 73B]|uniref:TOTE conflict system archaeo-eukaryotic primase domain-containing protein n=1 Tax=Methylopila sp. 73B TaxID=1120792 RepID=UPI000360DF9B|nr:hypothetical protein [Methylopila sp. 73B]
MARKAAADDCATAENYTESTSNASAPRAADPPAPADAPETPEARLLALFRGAETHHGTYDAAAVAAQEPAAGAKVEIKDVGGGVRTLKEPPTAEMWRRHLAGERPLGVSPVRADGTASWGAIDVDKYDGDAAERLRGLAARAAEMRLPLIVCRSKSGGAHLYLFLTEPVSAEKVQAALRGCLRSLGLLDDTEIFPKKAEPNRSGWINMPYFRSGPEGDAGDRFALKPDGLEMTVHEFADAAERGAVAPSALAALAASSAPSGRRASAAASGGGGGAGAPAQAEGAAHAAAELKRLAAELRATAEGGRNERLNRAGFAMGPMVAAGWVDRGSVLNALSDAARSAGMDFDEIGSTLNRAIDDGAARGAVPEIGGLRVERVVFVEGGREKLCELTLAHGDLRGEVSLLATHAVYYNRVKEQTYSQLGWVPPPQKAAEWERLLSEASRGAEVRQVESDSSVSGLVMYDLCEFLRSRGKADNKEEILLKKPWYDDVEGMHYFRMVDLAEFLEKKSRPEYRGLTQVDLSKHLRAACGGVSPGGGESRTKNLGSKGGVVRVRRVAEAALAPRELAEGEEIPLPPIATYPL